MEVAKEKMVEEKEKKTLYLIYAKCVDLQLNLFFIHFTVSNDLFLASDKTQSYHTDNIRTALNLPYTLQKSPPFHSQITYIGNYVRQSWTSQN